MIVNKAVAWGRGGGQVVSVLAFYSDDLSSHPADTYSFSVQVVFEKNQNKHKEAVVGPFKNKELTRVVCDEMRVSNSRKI